MSKEAKLPERRARARFGIQRELRYKILEDEVIVAAGSGHTLDLSSGGIAFSARQDLAIGAFVELSVSWPVLLDDLCPIRLIAFGRLIRSSQGRAACTIQKYEFRTQARGHYKSEPPVRSDAMLQRWAEAIRNPKSYTKQQRPMDARPGA